MMVGHVYRVRLSAIAGHLGLELFPTIGLLDRLHPPEEARHLPDPDRDHGRGAHRGGAGPAGDQGDLPGAPADRRSVTDVNQHARVEEFDPRPQPAGKRPSVTRPSDGDPADGGPDPRSERPDRRILQHLAAADHGTAAEGMIAARLRSALLDDFTGLKDLRCRRCAAPSLLAPHRPSVPAGTWGFSCVLGGLLLTSRLLHDAAAVERGPDRLAADGRRSPVADGSGRSAGSDGCRGGVSCVPPGLQTERSPAPSPRTRSSRSLTKSNRAFRRQGSTARLRSRRAPYCPPIEHNAECPRSAFQRRRVLPAEAPRWPPARRVPAARLSRSARLHAVGQ